MSKRKKSKPKPVETFKEPTAEPVETFQEPEPVVEEEEEEFEEEVDEEEETEIVAPPAKKPKSIASTVKPKSKPVKPVKQASVASLRYNEQVSTTRPVGVYFESIDGVKIVWYNTQEGKEVGRTEVTERDILEKIDRKIGYDYHIPYNAETVGAIIAQSFSKTQYYVKDGSHREVISLENLKADLAK